MNPSPLSLVIDIGFTFWYKLHKDQEQTDAEPYWGSLYSRQLSLCFVII